MYINTHICKHTHINTRTPAHAHQLTHNVGAFKSLWSFWYYLNSQVVFLFQVILFNRWSLKMSLHKWTLEHSVRGTCNNIGSRIVPCYSNTCKTIEYHRAVYDDIFVCVMWQTRWTTKSPFISRGNYESQFNIFYIQFYIYQYLTYTLNCRTHDREVFMNILQVCGQTWTFRFSK